MKQRSRAGERSLTRAELRSVCGRPMRINQILSHLDDSLKQVGRDEAGRRRRENVLRLARMIAPVAATRNRSVHIENALD